MCLVTLNYLIIKSDSQLYAWNSQNLTALYKEALQVKSKSLNFSREMGRWEQFKHMYTDTQQGAGKGQEKVR